MSQKENCTFWFWFLAQLLLTKIFNQQVIFRCLELALPLLHWLKYSFTMINFFMVYTKCGYSFLRHGIHKNRTLFFSHNSETNIMAEEKAGLTFWATLHIQQQSIKWRQRTTTAKQLADQTRRPRQLSKLTTTIYRTRAPFRPSLCCSCNLSQSLLAERRTCSLSPPASQPTSTHIHCMLTVISLKWCL